MKTGYFNTEFVSLQYKNTNRYWSKYSNKITEKSHSLEKNLKNFFFWARPNPAGLSRIIFHANSEKTFHCSHELYLMWTFMWIIFDSEVLGTATRETYLAEMMLKTMAMKLLRRIEGVCELCSTARFLLALLFLLLRAAFPCVSIFCIPTVLSPLLLYYLRSRSLLSLLFF